MKIHTDNVTVIKDARGNPAYVVMPVSDYEALVLGKKSEDYLPLEVSEAVLVKGYTLVKAWREHLNLGQEEMAKRLGILQGSYSKLEAKRTHTLKTRIRLADAFGITPEQLEI